MAKRTIFQVAGYKDEVLGEFASNSPRGRHEEWDPIGGNNVHRTTTEVGQQASRDRDDEGVKMVMQEAQADVDLVLVWAA